MSSARALASIVVGLACSGCQPAPAAPDPVAPVRALLTGGSWRLVDYHPDLPLDPVTQALLALQIHTMVVTFDGGTMHAASPTVNFSRPYVVESPTAYSFDLVSPGIGGGYLRSHCEPTPDGRRMVFRAQTDPWTGTGVLERDH